MQTMKRQNYFAMRQALSAVVALGSFLAALNAGAQANNVFSPGTSAITPITQTVETGPILDVVPYVLSDGYTINLALIPSDTEFGGYDQLNLPQVAGTLNVVELPTVLPKFTIRQLVTTVNVWDGQTVVLGGLITSSVQSTKDSVPVVGDIPLLGRLFQSESKVTKKDNLMIFVTSTIVDPAGNRVHSDDELPFAQSSVPVQSSDNIAPTESVKTVGMSGLEK